MKNGNLSSASILNQIGYNLWLDEKFQMYVIETSRCIIISYSIYHIFIGIRENFAILNPISHGELQKKTFASGSAVYGKNSSYFIVHT